MLLCTKYWLPDISMLSSLVHLKALILKNTRVTYLTPLKNLHKLETLHIDQGFDMNTLDALADIPNLTISVQEHGTLLSQGASVHGAPIYAADKTKRLVGKLCTRFNVYIRRKHPNRPPIIALKPSDDSTSVIWTIMSALILAAIAAYYLSSIHTL